MTNPAGPSGKISSLAPDTFGSLFQAIGGLRNVRAMLAMLGCLVAGILVAGAVGLLAGRAGGFLYALAVLLFLVAASAGVNAAGVLLMDQAKGVPLRSSVDASVFGLWCIPKQILIGLVLFVVALAVFLAIAVAMFICKIPVLGPIVYVVAFPLSVLIAGVTLTGLWLCLFLSMPAVWEGASVKHAITQALAIVRTRLVETLLMMIVIWFLAFFVGLIVFGVLGAGLLPTLGLSAGIIGVGPGGLEGLLGGFAGMAGMDGMGGRRGMGASTGGAGGAGQLLAGGIGFALLWAVATTLVTQVYLLGLILVHQRVSEGLDIASTERALSEGLDEARRRASEVSQMAKDAAERARKQARQRMATPASAATTPLAPGSACPSCHAAVAPDDAFCGACGHKLK